MIWDTKLTFEPHIKYLKARCQKSLNLLKVLSRTEWGADRTTLLKLYRSLVRSKLDYGCIVYGLASKTALAKLDPVQNKGLRLSLGAFRSSPVESLYVEAHEPPLEIRRDKLALQYILKLKANPENPAYDVVFNPKHQELYKNERAIWRLRTCQNSSLHMYTKFNYDTLVCFFSYHEKCSCFIYKGTKRGDFEVTLWRHGWRHHHEKYFFLHNLGWCCFHIWYQIEAACNILAFLKWPPFWRYSEIFTVSCTESWIY